MRWLMRWLVFVVWLGAVSAAHAGVAVMGMSNDPVQFNATPGRWSHTFVVYSDAALADNQKALLSDGDGSAAAPGGKKPLPGISIQITEFRTEAGKTVQAEPIALRPLGGADDPQNAASFTISAPLTDPDVYFATVVINVKGQAPIVHLLQVTVGSVTAGAMSALPVDKIGANNLEVTGDHAVLALHVRNSSSSTRTLHIAPPVVSRKQGAHEVPAGVGFGLRKSPDGPADTLRLTGGADGAVQVELSDLSPGDYKVEVQLSEPGLAPVTISGEVFVKYSWLPAALVIAFGVIIASMITQVRDVWLDSQSQRINLGRLVETLQITASGDAAGDALAELNHQAKELSLAIGDRKDCKADIENLGKRAAVFARANAMAAEAAELSDDRRAELRRKLDDIFRLTTLQTGEPDAQQKLSELESRDTARQELKTALDALAASITEHQIEADDQFIKQLGGLSGRVVHLRELYRSDKITEAEKEVASVRDTLHSSGRDAIHRATDRVPAWTTEVSWTHAMAQVKTLLAEPTSPYETVRTAYIDATVSVTLQDSKHPAAPQLQAATDLTAKLRLMAEIHTGALVQNLPQPKAFGAGFGAIGAALLIEPAAAKPAAERRPPEEFKWRDMVRRSARIKVLVLVVVMAIAVAGGMKALWIDNPTWGSGLDLLTAILWGSAAQVSAEVFMGLTALRTAFLKRV